MYVNYYDRIEKLAHESPRLEFCLPGKKHAWRKIYLAGEDNMRKYQLYYRLQSNYPKKLANVLKQEGKVIDCPQLRQFKRYI